MRQKIANYVDNAITVILFLVAGLTPLIFFNQTTEFFETPKLVFLIVATILLVGLWIFSWIVKGKISLSRTPLDVSLIALLIAVVASTYFSVTRPAAIFGNLPRVHGSVVSWVVYILLYFVTVSHLRNISKLKTFLYVLYGSGIVVAFVTLLSFFHLYLPFDFAKTVNFTPTGSSFATVAFLLLLLPLPFLSLIHKNTYFPIGSSVALTILFGVTVVLTGSLESYVGLLAIFAVCVAVSKSQQVKRSLSYVALPLIAVALALVLAYLPFPGNKIQSLEANFPKEIQLPITTSWVVSASAFRDAPFLGTGPSSYAYNFTTYKPASFNSLAYWNFSFDSAYDEFLQVLGTLGLFGSAAFVLFCLVILTASRRNLVVSSYEGLEAEEDPILVPSLAISSLVVFFLLAVHATTLVSLVMSLFVLAAFMMAQRPVREKIMEFSMGIRATTADNKQFDLFPVIIFIVFVIAAVPALIQLVSAVSADYYHRQALAQSVRNGTLTYQYLQKAETLNPQVDLYRVDMAQTNFALANALAAQKGPTKDNPQGTLTNQDRQTIQTLLSQAINEARVSVALAPRSARNWEVAASIYRNITGVAQNALAFSLSAYGTAIQLDPTNPALRVTVGGIYYAAKNYNLATQFFTDAINLKPDYANAYYNLAVTLRDNNDLTNAVLVEQQLVNLLSSNQKSNDYKTATTLLSDLKARLANAQQQEQGQPAPAAQQTSALQNSNLQNVTTLNNPPQVTPVPSVKPNPNANIPQVTVTPTPAQ